MRRMLALCALLLAGTVMGLDGQRAGGPATAGGNPSVTFETVKGAFVVEFFRSEAPKSVDHVMRLVRRNFYRGQRVHRVEASLVQFGDLVSRDMSRRAWWGRAGSGTPIGVAEFNKRTHVRGAVSLAHGGNPAAADSQLFIMKTASPGLNGKHVVIGRVTSGMDVVDRLEVTDMFKQVTAAPEG